MSNIATDINVNIEDLNRVLAGIQRSTSTLSLQELTKELETIAAQENVTTELLFDLAETSQLSYDLCSRVLALDHQIKIFKSNL